MRNFLLNLSRRVVMEDKQYASLDDVAEGMRTVVQKIIAPILTVIGVAAVIYAIYLGVLYAKAESADKRKEVQGRLIGACIGAVIIVVGAVVCFAVDLSGIFKSFQSSVNQ